MKHINKILILLFVSITLVSCNRDKGDADYLNNRGNSIFFSSDEGTLLIEEGADNIFSVTVGATAVVSSDSEYTITLDPSSTAVEGVDFTMLSTSTSFYNGNIVSTFVVQGDFDTASVDGKTAVFNLSTSDPNFTVASSNQFTLNLIKLCPIVAPFTGDYVLSVIDNGIFDTPTFTPGVVTISVGDEPTDRVFSVAPYPAFGVFAPMDFKFSLICEKVAVPGLQVTGVGCGGVTTTLGPQDVQGTYDSEDDSVFTIYYTDDEGGGSCGTPVPAAITLTKL